MQKPETRPGGLTITNGRGRLFVDTLLPRDPKVSLVAGADLYRVGDAVFPPAVDTGPAPVCRVEISPSQPAEADLFLHVLTTASSGTASVPRAVMEIKGPVVTVALPEAQVSFFLQKMGGFIVIGGARHDLAAGIVEQ
ncbi:MAG: hypothetical protein ABIF71_13585 [Planctomycetota bacterium]